MSNTDIIEGEIKSFILNPNAKVLVIKGKWGIGKTYTWERCLEECAGDDRPERYAYVTLFGLNSIQDIKKSIFENTVNLKENEGEPSIDTFLSNGWDKVVPSIKKITSLSKGMKIPYFSNMSGAVDLVSEFFIKDQLVCIDDLERRSKSLDIKDVLGLVSHLKEKKKCKIVLIYNDGEEGLEDVEKYNEKVISQELVFNPSTEECFDIIFKDCKYKHFVWNDTQKLKIQNIRVLGKIKYFVDKFLAEIPNFDEELKQFVVSMIVLYSWSYYYRQSDSAISYDYLSMTWRAKKDLRNACKPDDLKMYEQWDDLLRDYGVIGSNDLVRIISFTIANGYIPAHFIDASHIHQEALRKEKKKERLHSFWRGSVWGCFDGDEDKILKDLKEIYIQELVYIVPRDLEDIVGLLEHIDRVKLSNWYISKYIEQNKHNPQMFNTRNRDLFFRAPSGQVKEAFDTAFSDCVGRPDTKGIMTKLFNLIELTNDDAVTLERSSVEEWKEVFTDKNGRECAQHVMESPMVTKETKAVILKALSELLPSTKLGHYKFRESFPKYYEEIKRIKEEVETA